MSDVETSGSPPEDVRFALEALDVSRETLNRFSIHLRLLRKWQPTINLVGASTLEDPWRRHILDSVQLYPLLPSPAATLVDLGSGAGFPGLTLAIMGVESVHLIESDGRKAAFLRTVALETGAAVTVHASRAEVVEEITADIVTARAVAPLQKLLPIASRFLRLQGVCLFPKGRSAEDELTEAEQSWTMRVERFDSATDPSATILRLSDIARKPGLRKP